MVQLWGGTPIERKRERERPAVSDGNKKWLVLGGVLWLGIGIVYLVYAICADGSTWLAKGWSFLALSLYMSTLAFVQAWRWDRINRRRQAAARGDTTLVSLALAQPVPDEAALPLPHSVKIRPRKLQSALFWLAVAGAIQLVYWVYWRVTGDGSQWTGVYIGAGLALTIGLLALIFSRPREIAVTTAGLTVSDPYRRGTMLWRDMRLFAIRGRGKPGTHATRYELATEHWAVEWRRLRRIRWYSSAEPELPCEEYDREMEALLSLIAAKTGLPLYDLR